MIFTEYKELLPQEIQEKILKKQRNIITICSVLKCLQTMAEI
ncbi:MAG: hypothetical protein Q4E35_00370 [Eubacteriales bacterium]|nr:hypothetical protein [Eubacteriales bacterium]